MPPHARDEDRVARFQHRALSGGECFAETRMALEVGIGEIDHAHRLTAGCRFQRPGIEVADLLRRKKRVKRRRPTAQQAMLFGAS
jgi:hypothetical protein